MQLCRTRTLMLARPNSESTSMWMACNAANQPACHQHQAIGIIVPSLPPLPVCNQVPWEILLPCLSPVQCGSHFLAEVLKSLST